MRVDNDEVDDAALDSLERAMALARDHFAAAGLRCPIDTASTLLGVQLLPADAEEARQVRLHVIDTGLRLMEALRTQTVPHPDVQPALCGEVGSLLAQTDPEPRFIGGDLLCLGDWVAAGADDAFVAGGRLVAELADNLQVTPLGPQPGRVRVDGTARAVNESLTRIGQRKPQVGTRAEQGGKKPLVRRLLWNRPRAKETP